MGDTHRQASDTTTKRPEGFVQDEGNGNVWWGEPVAGEGYRVQPVWTAGEGQSVHVDVDDSLNPVGLARFIADLQEVERELRG